MTTWTYKCLDLCEARLVRQLPTDFMMGRVTTFGRIGARKQMQQEIRCALAHSALACMLTFTLGANDLGSGSTTSVE